MNYKYHLLKYKGPSTRLVCPQCGRKQCFAPYVDDNDQIVGEQYGRCNHESSCGYQLYPPYESNFSSQYYPQRQGYRQYQPPRQQQKVSNSAPLRSERINTISIDIVNKSIRLNRPSDLIAYLSTLFDQDSINRVIEEYRIGVTKAGDTIFYQIDVEGRCRTGKVMKYNRDTGHRIKDSSVKTPITWVHSLLKQQGVLPNNWELTQCLFGEHLLKKYPDKDVILVESEKTAIIGSIMIPAYIWVATGGKSQLGDKVDVLEGRGIVAFPDIDGYDTWLEKIDERPYLNIFVSDYLQKEATDEDREKRIDIADILLRWQRDRLRHPNPTTRHSGLDPESPELPTRHSALDAESPNPILIEIQKYISPQYRQEVLNLVEELGLEFVGAQKL